MQWTPPAPERLARRLLAYEAGADQTSEELAAAAERTYDRLRERLTVFLGPHGFDSLWARATLLAGHQLHEGGIEGGVALHPPPHELQASVRERTPSEVYTMVTTAFASFIALLFRFIGTDLGFRLLLQAWPELALDEADT
jgi:hypothetical protein